MSNIDKTDNKIDAYIEKNYTNNYNLWFHYNGYEFTFLNRDKEAEMFAINFKWKYLATNPSADNHTFTDNQGFSTEKREYYSVLSSIKGIEEIDDAIINLIATCTNLDIQADLTIHLNDKEYPLVRNTDLKNYFPSDRLKVSKKGFSKEQFADIMKDIKMIKKESTKKQTI